MLPVYALISVVTLGIGLIVLILWNEKRQEQPAVEEKKDVAPDAALTAEHLLQRVGIAEAKPAEKPGKVANLFSKIPLINKTKTEDDAVPLSPEKVSTGTASLRLDQIAPKPTEPKAPAIDKTLATVTEASLQQDELILKFHEIETKCQKLDLLFQEKSAELEKSERNLANEIKNRKEFNKVKDILEKEIRDLKDTNRNAQNTVTATQTESQSYTKRISVLEEKVTKLEKEILIKEQELSQTLAGERTYQDRINDLQDKLKKSEENIFEKNKKIEELIKRFKEESHKHEETPAKEAEPAATIPAEPVSEAVLDVEPVAVIPEPVSEPAPEPKIETPAPGEEIPVKTIELTPEPQNIPQPEEPSPEAPLQQTKEEGGENSTPPLPENPPEQAKIAAPVPLPEITLDKKVEPAGLPAPALTMPPPAAEPDQTVELKSDKKISTKPKDDGTAHLRPDILANQIKKELDDNEKII